MSHQRSTFFARDIVLTHGHETNFVWWMISDIAHDVYGQEPYLSYVARRRFCAQIVTDYIASLNPRIPAQFIAMFVQTQYNIMIGTYGSVVENIAPETFLSVFSPHVQIMEHRPIRGYHEPDTLTDYCLAMGEFCHGIYHHRMSQGAFYDTQAYRASCRKPTFKSVYNQPWAQEWRAIIGAPITHRDRATYQVIDDARTQALAYVRSWERDVAIEEYCETPDSDPNYKESSMTRIIAQWNNQEIILLEKIHHYVAVRENGHAHIMTMPFRDGTNDCRLVFPTSNQTINATRCRELLEAFAQFRAEPMFNKYRTLLIQLIIAKLWGDLGQIVDQYFATRRTSYRILIRTRDRSMMNLALLWGLPVFVDRSSDEQHMINDVSQIYLPTARTSQLTIRANPHQITQDQLDQINEYRKSIIAITGRPYEDQ